MKRELLDEAKVMNEIMPVLDYSKSYTLSEIHISRYDDIFLYLDDYKEFVILKDFKLYKSNDKLQLLSEYKASNEFLNSTKFYKINNIKRV